MRAQLLAILVVVVLDPANSQKCEVYKDWGFVCPDCQTMATCVNTAGTWRAIPLGTCDNKKNLYCNRSSKNCSETKDCGAMTPVDFVCNTEGIFPDPFDCQTYYACALTADSKYTTTKMQCTKPFAFSANSSDCSANSTDSICRIKQYKCDKLGDMGSWPGNVKIYYICVQNVNAAGDSVIYPALFRCPPGETFSVDRCSSSAITPPTTPSTNTTTTTPGGNQPIKCLKEGLVANPTQCTSYYYCNRKLQSVLYSCPPKSYFNNTLKACVIGSC